MHRYLILSFIAVAVVIAAVAYRAGTQEQSVRTQSDTAATTTPSLSIEDYIRQNISTLSPVREQLGGTFYVTHIEAHGGAGTVSYEDGHNAYTADFTYEVTAAGVPAVMSFTLR